MSSWFAVALDPGVQTGVAMLRMRESAPVLDTLSPEETIFFLLDEIIGTVLIEDSRDAPLFGKLSKTTGRARDKVARDVGGIDTLVRVYAAIAERQSDVILVPVKGLGKKWTSHYTQAICGVKQSNQHTRDALRVLYSRFYLLRNMGAG